MFGHLGIGLAIIGCTHAGHVDWRGSDPVELDRLVLTEPFVLTDVVETEDAIRAGVAVGHILFSGGYVTESTGNGQQNVSKEAVLGAGDAYVATARSWAAGPLLQSLRASAEVSVVPLAGSPPPPVRTDLRGSYEGLGKDNQPLPRFGLAPVALPDDVRIGLPPADAVLVPWIVSWYTHNGGWFLGQEYGAPAGARLRVLLAVHDPSTGAVLSWTDLSAKQLLDGEFSPSSAQTEDLAAATEQRLTEALQRRAPTR